MSASSICIVQVVLPVPLRRTFDYLVDKKTRVSPGMRVLVPFGRKRKQVGLIIKVSNTSEIDKNKLKYINQTLDKEPLLAKAHLHLLQWASDYYQHPLGEVIFHALPVLIRQGKAAKIRTSFRWQLTAAGQATETASLHRAPKQKSILELLQAHPDGLTHDELRALTGNYSAPLKALAAKGLVDKKECHEQAQARYPEKHIQLNAEQSAAVNSIEKTLDKYQCVLLDGVTGSGKTEVYIALVRQVITDGRQALILVPEIGLTPQFISRLQQQLGARLVVLHSALSANERLQNWLLAKLGQAPVILGTRSAIWAPMMRPGLIIVDEEHDLSYKQQDGFRYSARDIAIMRGKLAAIPVVLGSATPSMESYQNVNDGKFLSVGLAQRIDEIKPPQIRLIDMRAQPMTGALSAALIQAIGKELKHNKQVLLFLNRRGFSPVMMCHQCGWLANCRRCEIPLTYHKHKNKLLCHHCTSQRPVPRVCPECGCAELLLIGHGTERLTETLTDIFPAAKILRIDRDSTRRKGSMNALVDAINAGQADILVGTQMLAKGHHFPKLTLVGIVDIDRGLFSADFRASERMAQLFIQVSGRAGRATDPGLVVVQTHYPQHPLLQRLIQHDYASFARSLLQERKSTNLPPFSYLALLRVEANQAAMSEPFFREAIALLADKKHNFETYGPIPAPIAKRSGRLRYQLLILTNERNEFRRHLGNWCRQIEALPSAKKIRWSLDVDPQDML